MKLVVRVQYIGERARLLLREDLAAEYTKGLIDDLEWLGFPMPHEQKPIEKSGFMLCVWHVDRDNVRTPSTSPYPWPHDGRRSLSGSSSRHPKCLHKSEGRGPVAYTPLNVSFLCPLAPSIGL